MINIKQMHFTNRFYIFITWLFHYITLQFLAHTLGFAEAQHSTNTGNHTVLLCLGVGHTFSTVIENWRCKFDMWRRSMVIEMMRWWQQRWGWWKMLGWWVMMGGDAPHQFLVRQQFWREWQKRSITLHRKKQRYLWAFDMEAKLTSLQPEYVSFDIFMVL